MKPIIIIIAFLFSFSFLQAQVKSIDFVMPDGTKKQIPIEDIDSLQLNVDDNNTIIEIYQKNKSIIRILCYTITSLEIDSTNKSYSLIFHGYKTKYLWENYFSIELDSIDSIRFVKQYQSVSVNISGISMKNEYSREENNGNTTTRSSSTYTQSVNSFSDDNNDISLVNTDDLWIIPENTIKFFNCFFEVTVDFYETTERKGIQTIISLDTTLHIIKSLDYNSGKSMIQTHNAQSQSNSEGYNCHITNIPYIIDSSGNIIASMVGNSIKDHFYYEYSKSNNSSNGGGHYYYETYTLENIIKPTSKIEIKIYK